MSDIYETWVQEAGVDGFRIDTVKHVNMEFWQRFGPALQGYAASLGNDDFFMFGEVFDANPEFMSRYTTEGRLQATVDFGFQANAHRLRQGRAGQVGRGDDAGSFFAGDDWYTDADSNAYSLPTFLGNHDMGRIGKFLADTGATGDTLLERDKFAHSLMYLTRGQPVVYYGDEQGFTGDGGDQDARQDMFPSQVASYNDDDLIGTDATTAQRELRHAGTRCTSTSPTLSALRAEAPDAGRRRAGAPLRRRRTRASTRSAGSRPARTSSTSSPRTARTPRRRRPSRRTRAGQHFGKIWPAAAGAGQARLGVRP